MVSTEPLYSYLVPCYYKGSLTVPRGTEKFL